MLSGNSLPPALTEDWQYGGFGLYIHWPFCESKCPYCDFNSHVSNRIDHAAWKEAYLSELRRVAAETGPRALQTVFFGGGTPSLMEPGTVADILAEVRRLWPLSNDPEITLEANPGSVEAGRFSAFAQAGINRVSMGVQALNDNDLKRLGRLHSVADARRAFEIAKATFDRVSFDLIYARQDQSLSAWEDELNQALTWGIYHLSLYQLTIEPGTAFSARYAAGGLRGLPDEDLSADLHNRTGDICETAGLRRYEVSNYARPGSESRHNLIYWRYGDYAGIGPGAHGRLTHSGHRHATESWRNPNKWLEAVSRGTGQSTSEQLSQTEEASEFLLMGLRLAEGISISRLNALAGADIGTADFADLAELGLVETDGDRLRATARGQPVLNSLIGEVARVCGL